MNFQKSKSKNLFGRVKSEESQNWPKSVLKFFSAILKVILWKFQGYLCPFGLALGEGGLSSLARALRQARDHLAVFFDIGSECTSVTVSHRRCFDGFFCGLQNS